MRENFSAMERTTILNMRNPFEVYRKAEKENLSGKDLEVFVLVKGARLLRECQKDWDKLTSKQQMLRLGEACNTIKKYGLFFRTEASREDNPLPTILKRNILLLAGYVPNRCFSLPRT